MDLTTTTRPVRVFPRGAACGSLGLIMVVAFFLAGCGGDAGDGAPPPTSGEVGPDTSRYAPNPTPQVQRQKLELPEGANSDAVLAELNYQLKRWIVRNQRRPATFEEFVNSAQIQVPPPPPGKKYALGSQVKIELVNR